MNNLSYLLETCPNHIKKDFLNISFDTFDKILIQNEDANFVYIMKKGKAKVYSLTSSGIRYLERIYSEYELFGELEVFINKPILNYVEALEPCEVIKIPKDCFLEWIKYDSNFSLYINIQLSHKLYTTSINSKANIVYPLKHRLIFFLWRFLDEHNLNTINKDLLVEGIGSNIRSVNRIIKELVSDNIIDYNKGFIKVKDMNKLINIVFSYNYNDNTLETLNKNQEG